jgi:hypothetical protein
MIERNETPWTKCKKDKRKTWKDFTGSTCFCSWMLVAARNSELKILMQKRHEKTNPNCFGGMSCCNSLQTGCWYTKSALSDAYSIMSGANNSANDF